MTLVRSQPRPHDDLDELADRLAELEATLRERQAEVTRTRLDLAAFGDRYRQTVGRLHDEVDELNRAIAEAEQEHRSEPPAGGAEGRHAPEVPRPEPAPRFTTDEARKLFRAVAKAIHPDLASDAMTRDERHSLMVEANRAYERGDEMRLRAMLVALEHGGVPAGDEAASREWMARRLSLVEQQLDLCAAEFDVIKSTPLWQLKTMVDEAAGRGKDLMADMVARLKRDVLVARNRLDALQWHP